jgi:hypothetical protein
VGDHHAAVARAAGRADRRHLSLGYAAWCVLRGPRAWKMLMTAGSLMIVLACGKLLEI